MVPIRRSIRLIASYVILVSLASPSLKAADKTEKKIDPKADEVLHRLADFMKATENFRAKATMDWRFEDRGNQKRFVNEKGKQHVGTKYTIAFERPNRFALTQKVGDVGATVVSDGDQIFARLPQRESYALDPAPDEFAPIMTALRMAAEVTNMPGIGLVGALASSNPYKELTDGLNNIEYLGQEKVDRKKCDHLKLGQDDSWIELWIEAGDRPVLRRFAAELPPEAARIGDRHYGSRGGSVIKVRVAFNRWNIDGKIQDRHFKYKVPKKDQEVATVLALSHAYPPHPLLGKKAPKLKLALHDGGKLNLSDHKGEHIVVLDFWATWCGPCEMAFPSLIEVTDAYKDQGVRFYAVNQLESKSEIESYLERKKFALTVALDDKGAAANKYRVSGLPQTVIIGKDGTIQAVHQGYSRDLKEKLKEEIETLLSGQKLAKK